MKFIKILVITLSLVSLIGVGNAAAAASPSGFTEDACSGLTELSPGQGCGTKSDNTITNLAGTVVDLLSVIIGIIAVIMLMISGFRYITAGGDSNAVAAAKNTLVYALIGLIIAVLAQLLVHLVLNTASNINSSGNGQQKQTTAPTKKSTSPYDHPA